jgi:hemoglobin/transferrin/lactoferrin receptor protein
MKKISRIILLSVTTFLYTTVDAQTVADTSIHHLKEVVISVNKTEEQKSNVAQQVDVITSAEKELLQNQNAADLVANSPGVFVQKSQQGGGSPVIRGFEANRVLLVIDGVRMNNLIYRGGHLQNIITVDESMIDRTEILFGPSSTIYGSDALGGVIHFYTRKPGFSTDSTLNFNVNASSRIASANNEFTAHVDVNAGGKRFASLTSFNRSRFGDLRGGANQNPFYLSSYGERPYYVDRINGTDSLIKNEDRFLQVQSGYTQYDLMQKFSFRPTASVTHDVNLQYSTSTDIPRYDRLTDPSGTGLRFSEWYYGPQKRLLGAYDLSYLPSGSFFNRLHAGVNFQQIEESRHTRRFGNDNLQHRIEKVNVIGFSFDAERRTSNHDLRFGIDGQSNALESTAANENIGTSENTALDTRYPDGTNSLFTTGLYFSHGWNINSQTRFTDGFRIGYSKLKSTFEDTTFFKFPFRSAEQSAVLYSGSIGLIHRTEDDVTLSALVSSGFRVPNIDDLAKVFESGSGNLIVPNPDLKPEKTITYEIGVRSIRQSTGMELNMYYTDYFDAIVTNKFKLNGQDSVLYNGQLSQVVANQNQRRAYIYGFSTRFLFNQDRKVKGELSASYTYGRIKTDSIDYPLDHIPPFAARLQFMYAEKKFSSLFYIQFNGWKRLKDYNLGGEDNQQYATSSGMPAWFTLNLKNSYRINRSFILNAGIENILDVQYRTFASGVNSAGRNFYLSVGFNY